MRRHMRITALVLGVLLLAARPLAVLAQRCCSLFALPVQALTLRVPETIDHTCTTDVTGALNTWFHDSVPDGAVGARTTVRFQPGCYRIDGTFRLTDRHHLSLRGSSTELRATGELPNTARAQIELLLGDDIQVSGFTIRGTNPEKHGYDGALEHDANIYVTGASNVLLNDLTLLNAHGDGLQISPGGNWDAQGVGAVISRNVQLRNSVIRNTGRMGVAITAADGVIVGNNHFSVIGYHVIDQEPEGPTWPVRNITIANNRIESVYLSLFVNGSGYGYDVSNLTITRNIYTAGVESTGTCWGPIVLGSDGVHPLHVRITDNNFQSRSSILITHATDVYIARNMWTGGGLCTGTDGAILVDGGSADFLVEDNVWPDASFVIQPDARNPVVAPFSNFVCRRNYALKAGNPPIDGCLGMP